MQEIIPLDPSEDRHIEATQGRAKLKNMLQELEADRLYEIAPQWYKKMTDDINRSTYVPGHLGQLLIEPRPVITAPSDNDPEQVTQHIIDELTAHYRRTWTQDPAQPATAAEPTVKARPQPEDIYNRTYKPAPSRLNRLVKKIGRSVSQTVTQFGSKIHNGRLVDSDVEKSRPHYKGEARFSRAASVLIAALLLTSGEGRATTSEPVERLSTHQTTPTTAPEQSSVSPAELTIQRACDEQGVTVCRKNFGNMKRFVSDQVVRGVSHDQAMIMFIDGVEYTSALAGTTISK